MGGDGDDFLWEGLACPPLEDYAFNFHSPTSVLQNLMVDDSLFQDDFLDNPLLEIEEDGETVDNKFDDHITEANVATGKGKLLNTLRQQLQVEACQPMDNSRVDCTNQIVTVQRKGGSDMILEGLANTKPVQGRPGVKLPDRHTRVYGNHGKGKVIKALHMNMEQIKDFLGEKDVFEEHKDKKRRILDCYETQPMLRKETMRLDHTDMCDVRKKRKGDYRSKPMQIKNMTGLVHTNQTAVVLENTRIVEYESRFEASKQMLHKAYGQAREAKERKHIQVISFQKPEAQQPGSKGKANGKPSFRQRVMAMGTRKSKKKFPPYKMLCSCNHDREIQLVGTECNPFTRGDEAEPSSQCCNAYRALRARAKTGEEKKQFCFCVHEATSQNRFLRGPQTNPATRIPRIDALPEKCGLPFLFSADPKFDCNTLN